MLNHKAIIIVLLFSLLGNIYIILNNPLKETMGDEAQYIRFSHSVIDWAGKAKQLFPGFMQFQMQPPFSYSFYALAANKNISSANHQFKGTNPNKHWNKDIAIFFKRVIYINLILLLVSGFLLYLVGLHIGLKTYFSAISVALVLLNPRILFYVQSLWPELLHFSLVLLFFLLLFKYLDSKKLIYLIGSSIILAYCSLTKGITGFYFWIAVVLLVYSSWKHQFNRVQVFRTVFLFTVPYLLLINAQKLSNNISYNEYIISSNKWYNIELGLKIASGVSSWEIEKIYWRAEPTLREQKSRERVFQYLSDTPLTDIVQCQIMQFANRQLNNSFFKTGLERKRWQNSDSLKSYESTVQDVSWILIIAGLFGLVFGFFETEKHLFLSGYIGYYLIGLLVVGFNARFYIQAIPVLALFGTFFMQLVYNTLRQIYKKRMSVVK